jgi:hypothetical protein
MAQLPLASVNMSHFPAGDTSENYPEIPIVHHTPTIKRKIRGQEWEYHDPQIGSILAKNGSGYGDGQHATYVVTSVKKTKAGYPTEIVICKVTSHTSENVSYDTWYKRVLKAYFSQDYPGQWLEPDWKRGNSYTFDKFVEDEVLYPYGR